MESKEDRWIDRWIDIRWIDTDRKTDRERAGERERERAERGVSERRNFNWCGRVDEF